MPFYNIFYVTKSEPEAFYIVNIPFGDTVEAFEYTAWLGGGDAYAIIRQIDLYSFFRPDCPDGDIYALAGIFDRIVEHITDHIGEM